MWSLDLVPYCNVTTTVIIWIWFLCMTVKTKRSQWQNHRALIICPDSQLLVFPDPAGLVNLHLLPHNLIPLPSVLSSVAIIFMRKQRLISRKDNESKSYVGHILKISIATLKAIHDTGGKKIHLGNFINATNIITWHLFTKSARFKFESFWASRWHSG